MGFGHIIPHLVERFLKKENPFKIYGGDQTRSFCYVDDGALGTIQAMECKNNSENIFHIGNDVEITIEEFVKKTGEYFNYKGDYELAPTYPGSVSRRCPDLTKSKNILGFKINFNWQKSLFLTLDWYYDFFQNNPNKKCFEAPDELKIE